ncbi:MAG: hypothetical protein WBZ48_09715 [Bacteroidota bacterium]
MTEKDYTKLSDVDLQLLSHTTNPDGFKAALTEIDRRQKEEHEKDQRTQKKIKQITFWTLIVSLAILVITLFQLFHIAGI